MKTGFALLLAALLALPLAASAQDPVKRARVKELMAITGAARLGNQFADAVSRNLADTLKASRPDIPERVFAVLHQEMVNLFQEQMDVPGGLIDRIVPVYERHFTTQELDELIAFYRTPIGRKAVAAMPAVMQESIAAGRAWGQGLGPEITRRVEAALKREGIQPPAKK